MTEKKLSEHIKWKAFRLHPADRDSVVVSKATLDRWINEIATLEKRLAAADTERKTLRGHYLSNEYLTELEDKCADYTLRLEAAEAVLTQIRTYLSKGATIRATDPSVPTLCIDGNNCSGNLTVDFDAEKEKQQAIDAALESLKTSCRKCEYDEYDGSLIDHCPDCQRKIVTALYAIKGTNPLAEAQAKLEFANQHNRRMAQIQELDAASIVELQTTLAEAQARIAELEDTINRMNSATIIKQRDDLLSQIAELDRELAEARKDAERWKHARNDPRVAAAYCQSAMAPGHRVDEAVDADIIKYDAAIKENAE